MTKFLYFYHFQPVRDFLELILKKKCLKTLNLWLDSIGCEEDSATIRSTRVEWDFLLKTEQDGELQLRESKS